MASILRGHSMKTLLLGLTSLLWASATLQSATLMEQNKLMIVVALKVDSEELESLGPDLASDLSSDLVTILRDHFPFIDWQGINSTLTSSRAAELTAELVGLRN